MQKVLFVEVGMGADQHGQDATKAAVRACRNAIEFNSIPSIRDIVPGGYDNMKLHIQLGVPEGSDVDLGKVRAVFPYGNIVEPVDVCVGGAHGEERHRHPGDGGQERRFRHRRRLHHRRILALVR